MVSTVDNFIRPYLISQGAKLPLLLIFVGVIGGLLAYGFIGLFVGATLLGVGYTIFRSWLGRGAAAAAGHDTDRVAWSAKASVVTSGP